MNEAQDLSAVQELVKSNPVLKSYLLHRLGNIACALNGYLDLMDKPDTTEAQKEKYLANARLSSDRIFTFLVECGIEQEWRR